MRRLPRLGLMETMTCYLAGLGEGGKMMNPSVRHMDTQRYFVQWSFSSGLKVNFLVHR